MQTLHKYNIAIFASGKGGNARAILDASIRPETHFKVSLIVTNNETAGVLDLAMEWGVATLIINKENFYTAESIIPALKPHPISYIILAGFLWKLPPFLLGKFPSRILNIHPALLPAYGGKGMYGRFVHEAVIRNRETVSGISIHYVDELYDHGKILFQKKCNVLPGETPETLAAKITILEHEHYWVLINNVIKQMISGKREFVKTGFVNLIRGLQSEQQGSWGKMKAQQMVEHITGIVKVSNGKNFFQLVTPEALLPKYLEFLWSEKEFKENTKAPETVIPEAPEPVRSHSIEAAVVDLGHELESFFSYFENPNAAPTRHPVFGDLNFEAWIQLHYKHLTHHAKQFDLL
jgi:phosphoribosylglycinamide formyltransferase-1